MFYVERAQIQKLYIYSKPRIIPIVNNVQSSSLFRSSMKESILLNRLPLPASSSAIAFRVRTLGIFTSKGDSLHHLVLAAPRALLTLDDNEQLEIAKKIVAGKLSVRETERLVNRCKLELPETNFVNSSNTQKTQQLSKILTDRLSSKVKIQFNSKGAGKVIIHVNSLDEAEWLVEHIKIE
jgi:ParB family transcriptional regulator, chromosome partitioning protein